MVIRRGRSRVGSTISRVKAGAGRERVGGGAVGADKGLKELGREEKKRWTVSCRRVGSKRGWL